METYCENCGTGRYPGKDSERVKPRVGEGGREEIIQRIPVPGWLDRLKDAVAGMGLDPEDVERQVFLVDSPDFGTNLETVDHPEHYGGDTTYEAIKVIEAWGLNFNLGSALKYIRRAGKKPGVDTLEDLEKARWYVNREVERRERELDGTGE